jgi:branched-chain amino acid transport system substrate-binding protein
MRVDHLAAGAAAAALALSVGACGSNSGSAATGSTSGPIKIGASIPLSGGLAGFGAYEKWGYQHAVDEVNKAGGIKIDGKQRTVELILLDDKTDPNVSATNVNQLITQNKVDALLGSCTATLVEPGALVAERKKVPMVAPCETTDSFLKLRPTWNYVSAIFFAGSGLTNTVFSALKELNQTTNKKVAIIHSNGASENDIGGTLWPADAKKYGYQVVFNQANPPDTTQFGSAIAAAKRANADILLSVFPPPATIALRKQIAAAGYKPKVLQMEEGGEPEQFPQAVGKLANGVTVFGYWDPSFPYPGAAELKTAYESETGQTQSQHIADTYTAAAVLLDAIKAAGSTDNDKIAAAIDKTNKEYPVGPVKFTDNTATLPTVQTQWQDGKAVVIAPKKLATGEPIFPMPGA